jgi:hypothetical protein
LASSEAKHKERVWLKNQTAGDIDETRIVDGLAGEKAVYKSRGVQSAQIGAPQLKPKHVHFCFDVSAR